VIFSENADREGNDPSFRSSFTGKLKLPALGIKTVILWVHSGFVSHPLMSMSNRSDRCEGEVLVFRFSELLSLTREFWILIEFERCECLPALITDGG
jgi:hypothetical protein